MKMRRRLGPALVGAAAALFITVAHAAVADVPSAIQMPPGNTQYLTLHADGFQIYQCSGAGVWTFARPFATLTDSDGTPVGYHAQDPATGLPAWNAFDGSRVVAKKVASAPSPDGSIPWLLLQVQQTVNGRTFPGDSTYVQRINTQGGLAPDGGCDPAVDVQPFLSSYEADYVFWHVN